MVKVSVVIPVYNVGPYIEKCLESVAGQTLREIQVILVDDGSRDRSGRICDAYAAEDDRIQVIHKKNGGLSDARNAGMKLAKGEYIVFIDSDDYVSCGMLEYMYRNIVESGADISTCGVYDVYDDHINAQETFPGELVSAEKAFSYILQGTNIRGAVWNKMMRREIISGLEFPAGKNFEDVFFTCEMMKRVKSVYVGTEPMYYYVHRENSISTMGYNQHDYDIIEGYARTYRTVKKYFPALEKEAQFRVYWSWFHVFDKILATQEYWKWKGYRILKKKIRRNMGAILRNPYFQKTRKLAVILLFFSDRLYRRVMLWNQKRNFRLKKQEQE